MQDLPKWIGWFHYLDFLHYAWASLMLNEFEDRPVTYLNNQSVGLHLETRHCLHILYYNEHFSQLAEEVYNLCVMCAFCYSTLGLSGLPLGVLQFLGYYGLPQHNITKWEYLGIEVLFFIMFFLLAWAALKYKKHGKR